MTRKCPALFIGNKPSTAYRNSDARIDMLRAKMNNVAGESGGFWLIVAMVAVSVFLAVYGVTI